MCLQYVSSIMYAYSTNTCTITGGSPPNFNFFNINPQILQRNRKVHLSNCLETNFHNISNIRELLDVGIIANASF